MDYPTEFWISTLWRSQSTTLLIRRGLNWIETPIRKFDTLDTIGEEARKKVPGCEDIFSHVQTHLIGHPGTSVGAALLASPKGEEYMRNKAHAVLQMANNVKGDIFVVGHENLIAPLAWEALGTVANFEAIGGELRYLEGVTMTLDDNNKITDARVLRNPYYK